MSRPQFSVDEQLFGHFNILRHGRKNCGLVGWR
jgi:hypothetical protein